MNQNEIELIVYEDKTIKQFLATLCIECNPHITISEIERAIENSCNQVEISVLTLPLE